MPQEEKEKRRMFAGPGFVWRVFWLRVPCGVLHNHNQPFALKKMKKEENERQDKTRQDKTRKREEKKRKREERNGKAGKEGMQEVWILELLL